MAYNSALVSWLTFLRLSQRSVMNVAALRKDRTVSSPAYHRGIENGLTFEDVIGIMSGASAVLFGRKSNECGILVHLERGILFFPPTCRSISCRQMAMSIATSRMRSTTRWYLVPEVVQYQSEAMPRCRSEKSILAVTTAS